MKPYPASLMQLSFTSTRNMSGRLGCVENATITVGGTTDEFPSLTMDERVAIAHAWRQAHPPGSTPKLVLHVGSDCIPDAQRLGRLAEELHFDGALVSVPSKFKPPTLDMHFDCFCAIAAACGALPVYYYHFPAVLHDDFDLAELVAGLQRRWPSVAGIKLSGTKPEEAARVVGTCSRL